jgi:hypothetical protein
MSFIWVLNRTTGPRLRRQGFKGQHVLYGSPLYEKMNMGCIHLGIERMEGLENPPEQKRVSIYDFEKIDESQPFIYNKYTLDDLYQYLRNLEVYCVSHHCPELYNDIYAVCTSIDTMNKAMFMEKVRKFNDTSYIDQELTFILLDIKRYIEYMYMLTCDLE